MANKFFSKINKWQYILAILFLLVSIAGVRVALAEEGAVILENPLGDTVDIVDVIARVIKTIFAFTGILALLQFIYGGLLWMTSSGNQEKITKGKNTLLWAILGIIVVFMSYAFVRFVIDRIKNA